MREIWTRQCLPGRPSLGLSGVILILQLIINFRKEEQDDAQAGDTEQDLVSPSVQRFIILAVNLLFHQSSTQNQAEEALTLLAAILEHCTIILYNAEATVRVRTDPALREVIATMAACMYGLPIKKMSIEYRIHGFTFAGSSSRASKNAKFHISANTPRRSRWLIRSDSQVKIARLIMKMTYAGIVRRFVSKVLKPSDRICSVM